MSRVGWAIIVSEAAPSAAAARDSPTALMILARFYRSAPAWAAATCRAAQSAARGEGWCSTRLSEEGTNTLS